MISDDKNRADIVIDLSCIHGRHNAAESFYIVIKISVADGDFVGMIKNSAACCNILKIHDRIGDVIVSKKRASVHFIPRITSEIVVSDEDIECVTGFHHFFSGIDRHGTGDTCVEVGIFKSAVGHIGIIVHTFVIKYIKIVLVQIIIAVDKYDIFTFGMSDPVISCIGKTAVFLVEYLEPLIEITVFLSNFHTLVGSFIVD